MPAGIRSAQEPHVRDDTAVEIVFMPKGEKKSVLVVTHQKLPDKPTVEKMKSWWSERLDALASLLQ